MTVELGDLKLHGEPTPFASFNGISDFSEVITNVVNTLSAVLRNRLESFLDAGDQVGIDKKLQAVVNKVLSLIPSQIDLPHGLYLDGLLFNNPTAMNEELTIRLETITL